jgi:hypothetical protein
MEKGMDGRVFQPVWACGHKESRLKCENLDFTLQFLCMPFDPNGR